MSTQERLRRRKSPGGNQRSTWLKFVGSALLLVVLVTVLVTAYVKSQKNYVPTDPETLCPIGRPPSEVLVLLLDMSNAFSEPQRVKLQNEVERLKAGMRRLGLIEVYAVDQLDQRLTSPVVHLCNPGTGDSLNGLYQNPEMAHQKWVMFSERLDAEIQRLMSAPESQTSAILEAIQAVALRTFDLPAYDGIPKHLVIVSDLLQNVPGRLSQYDGIESFSQFKQSSYYSDVRADLSGVSVTILYLVRPNAPQRWPEHRLFWEEYLHAQGATIDSLVPVWGNQ